MYARILNREDLENGRQVKPPGPVKDLVEKVRQEQVQASHLALRKVHRVVGFQAPLPGADFDGGNDGLE